MRFRMRRVRFSARALALALVVALGACGEEPPEEAPAGASAPPPAASPASPAPRGPVDAALADRGQQLFQTRGCIGCHTIGGGRLTGPDLDGITERRDFPWIIAMIVNPDSMLRNDETARQLFNEYMTPMLNMGVTEEEARAMYEYLRRDAGG